MKREVRILGIDDSPFDKSSSDEVLVIGAVTRGGGALEGLLSFKVSKDGEDATQRIADSVSRSKFRTHLRAILLGGLAVAGFNVINPIALSEMLSIPVIVVMRSMPEKMAEALSRLGLEQKARLVRRLPSPVQHGEIFFQAFGCDENYAREVLDIACTNSKLPEPLRLAHIIASGVVLGESKGGA